LFSLTRSKRCSRTGALTASASDVCLLSSAGLGSDDSSCIGSSRHQPTSNPEGNSGNATGRALAKSVIRDIRCHFLGRLTTCFVAQTPSSPLFKANFSESSSCSQESSSPSDSNSEGEGEEEHFQDNQDFELVFIAPSSKCFCPRESISGEGKGRGGIDVSALIKKKKTVVTGGSSRHTSNWVGGSGNNILSKAKRHKKRRVGDSASSVARGRTSCCCCLLSRKCICSGERQLGTGDLKTHQVEIDELNLPEKAKLLSTAPSTCNEPTADKLTKNNCRLNNTSIATSVLKSRELLQSYKSRRTRSLERNHRHLVNIDPSNKSYLQSIADSRLAQTYDPASKVNASSRKKNKKQREPSSMSNPSLSGSASTTTVTNNNSLIRYHPDPTTALSAATKHNQPGNPKSKTVKPLKSSGNPPQSVTGSLRVEGVPTHVRLELPASSSSNPKSTTSNPSLSSSESNSPPTSLQRRRHRNRQSQSPTSQSSSQSTRRQSKMSNIGKPARGWLHPDNLLAQEGINYSVRYVGCLEVQTAMKALDFETRSLIAKECIHIVCQAAETSGIGGSSSPARKSDKKITRMLGTVPTLDRSGSNVQLTITSLSLKLSQLDTGNPIYEHDMPNISFASGGDTDTLDYVAYVAKDKRGVRSCFVLECKGGVAQEVITTIGQAFELRFKEFLKRTPNVHKPPPLNLPTPHATSTATPPAPMPRSNRRPEVEYYNDLPGKSPPDSSRLQANQQRQNKGTGCAMGELIDFNDPAPNSANNFDPRHPEQFGNLEGDRPSSPGAAGHAPLANLAFPPSAEPGSTSHRDPFDMSPFAVHPPATVLSTGGGSSEAAADLKSEIWYHGPISRIDAETLLVNDGDFLVRESKGSRGQYVLTGMQQNSKKAFTSRRSRGRGPDKGSGF